MAVVEKHHVAAAGLGVTRDATAVHALKYPAREKAWRRLDYLTIGQVLGPEPVLVLVTYGNARIALAPTSWASKSSFQRSFANFTLSGPPERASCALTLTVGLNSPRPVPPRVLRSRVDALHQMAPWDKQKNAKSGRRWDSDRFRFVNLCFVA